MFEKKDQPAWKGITLVLVGVVVLVSGIYIGSKTQDKKTVQNPVKHEQSKEKTNEAFKLSNSCEIWLHKDIEDETDAEQSSVMLGTVPKGLLNKTQGEIVSYLKDKYPDKNIESIGEYEIVLSDSNKNGNSEQDKSNKDDISKANKYTIEDDNGYIGLYKYDNKGKRKLIEKTHVKVDSLPKAVQNDIKQGIYMNSEDEAYSRLEDFGS